jgi:hypothetical protein
VCIRIAICIAIRVVEREVAVKIGERGATSGKDQSVVDRVAKATTNGR